MRTRTAASRAINFIVIGSTIALAAVPRAHAPHAAREAGLRGERQARNDSRPRRFEAIHAPGAHARWTDLKFTHLTTNDGLSQNAVTTILQDRRGFLWFATREGLNRYDGNAFVAYKNKAEDPESLSANLIDDLMEDDKRDLWIATYTGGVNKFNPPSERFARYQHDPRNPNSLIADSVNSIARDRRGSNMNATQTGS